MGRLKIGNRVIEVSNEGKTLFPEAGLTKGDLIDYYRRIAETILPHLHGRPISMQRHPDGIETQGFYEKQRPNYFPDWIESATIPLRAGGSQKQVVIADAATLVYLAEKACITPHAWLSRAETLEAPDRMVFDLDPPAFGSAAQAPGGQGFSEVVFAARAVRDALDEVGLPAFVQTTGSRGLHVVVPLDRGDGFDAVRDFAGDLARLLAGRHPDRLTTEQRKAQRRGRLFLDVARNAYGQTAVPPYAVRALAQAPVAAPLDWHELGARDLGPQRYTIANLFRRLGAKDDPWAGLARRAHGLAQPRRRLDALLEKGAGQ